MSLCVRVIRAVCDCVPTKWNSICRWLMVVPLQTHLRIGHRLLLSCCVIFVCFSVLSTMRRTFFSYSFFSPILSRNCDSAKLLLVVRCCPFTRYHYEWYLSVIIFCFDRVVPYSLLYIKCTWTFHVCTFFSFNAALMRSIWIRMFPYGSVVVQMKRTNTD